MYIIKINNSKNSLNRKNDLRSLFIKMNDRVEALFFGNDPVFLTCTAKLPFNYVLKKVKDLDLDLEIVEKISSEFSILTSFLLTYSDNDKIYDLIYLWGRNHCEELNLEVQAITEVSRKDIINNANICRHCHTETPTNINFCIFCGNDNNRSINTTKEKFQIKINKIIDVNIRIKIAKYFTENSEIKDYKKMLDCFSHLPHTFEIKASIDELNKVIEVLNEYSIEFNYNASRNVDIISKIFQSKAELGNFEIKNEYFDHILSKNIAETLKSSSSPVLRKALTKCIFEVYRMVDFIKTTETSVKVLLEPTKKDTEEIILKFLNFMKRANKLNTYFEEKSLESINKEILFIKDKVERSNQETAIEMYRQSLELKEKEIEEYMKLNKSLEIIYSQVISVTTLLSSMRTKIAVIDTYDIQNNKGDFAEINKMKENILLNLKTVENTLY
ncbi:MAG: hypothetical protein AABZ74_15790 [Cyanobacteriota bacterium]